MKKILLIVMICFTGGFIKAQLSYCDDFESGGPGWYASSTSGSVWQLDTLSGSGGNHVWGVGLDTNYLANTVAFLYSPVFGLFAPLNLKLCFWLNYRTEIYQDGMHVEYSIDSGLTWQVLGNAGMGPYWYNSFFISSSGTPGWTGILPVWQQATFIINNIFRLQL